MLHAPSYNLGLQAGKAWQAIGQDHFTLSEIEAHETPENSARVRLIESMFKMTEDRFFFPSSWFEGFFNAFHYEDSKIIALNGDPEVSNKSE